MTDSRSPEHDEASDAAEEAREPGESGSGRGANVDEVEQRGPRSSRPFRRPPASAFAEWTEVLLGFRWPLAMIVLASLVYLAHARACRHAAEGPGAAAAAIERAGEAAATVAERFRSGRITTTFTASLPRLLPGGGLSLEVAALEATETFTRTDERRVLFDVVDLGTTVTQVRVPATYRFHVRLDEPWQLDVEGHTCIVRAPAIRPTLAPAFDTSGMEKLISRGWARFGASEQMDALERTITPSLTARAEAPETIDLVRETARARVAELVERWLLVEEHWRPDRFRAVVVLFADEAEAGRSLPEPSVVLIVPERGESGAEP